jgi:hypothetical protein
MNYTNIDDIKSDFGLQTEDISEIKTQLKELLKNIHPDINGGDQFKSKLDEINYKKIIAALEYLNQNFSIVPTSELTVLATILKDGMPAKKEEDQAKNLEKKTDKIIKAYYKSNLTPKISSTIFAAITTYIWFFPNIITDHPVLSKYFSPEAVMDNLVFTGIWFCSLIFTASYWAVLKRREEKIKDATRKLNIESVQNELFESFTRTKKYIAKKEEAKFLTFSKDELITHLTELDIFNLQYNPRRLRSSRPITAFLFSFSVFPNRNIELDFAQTLADIIVERAKRKNLIQLEQDNNLSDTYKLQLK